MRALMRTIALAPIAGFVFASTIYAQDSAAADGDGINAKCEAPEHRQFDFWLGDWTVTNPQGQVAGNNKISRISDGCALLERWTGAGGGTGTSINMYEPGEGRWTQVWVSPGLVLHLHGGIEDGSMVLSGERKGKEDSQVIDKITWTPNADGSVRQHWEISQDGGETWKTSFDGTYRKAITSGR